jgi:hypothetical protein
MYSLLNQICWSQSHHSVRRRGNQDSENTKPLAAMTMGGNFSSGLEALGPPAFHMPPSFGPTNEPRRPTATE